MPNKGYKSFCCQHCGAPVGWIGRFIDFFIGCGWRGCYWGER